MSVRVYILIFLHILVALGAIVFFNTDYKNIVKEFVGNYLRSEELSKKNGYLLFTKDQLAEYDGKNIERNIYLAILGEIFDVTKGKKHYGSGCSYSFFAGKDASAAFITGEFDSYTPESDNVLSLKPADILNLFNWKEFYEKEYKYVGKLIGRFYDKNGEKTDYYKQVEKILQNEKERKVEIKPDEYPACNIEWSAEKGTKVWCTNLSGGIERSWAGYPRKLMEKNQKEYRCVCVQESKITSDNIQEYENCDSNANICHYKVVD